MFESQVGASGTSFDTSDREKDTCCGLLKSGANEETSDGPHGLSAAKIQVAGWDLSRGGLSKIEAQLRRVNDAELLVLARALGCEVQDLYPSSRWQLPRTAQHLPTRLSRSSTLTVHSAASWECPQKASLM